MKKIELDDDVYEAIMNFSDDDLNENSTFSERILFILDIIMQQDEVIVSLLDETALSEDDYLLDDEEFEKVLKTKTRILH